MHDIIEALLQLSRDIVSLSVTTDTIICPGTCYLFHASIESDGGGEADAVLYNGHSSNSPYALHIDCADEESYGEPYFPPKYFSRGLFIDVGSNVAGVTVDFLPVKK